MSLNKSNKATRDHDPLNLGDLSDIASGAYHFISVLRKVNERIRAQAKDETTKIAAKRVVDRHVAAFLQAARVPQDSVRAWSEPQEDDHMWASRIFEMCNALAGKK